MTLCKLSRPLLLATLLVGTLPTFAQQRDMSKVEIKPQAVAGSVHMLFGSGGNIGVSVGPDGVLIVDDQFAPLAEKIEAALGALDKGPLKFVLNTHWHGDHTGGNAYFGRKGHIIAQDNVRKRLTDKSDTPKEALPVLTFEKSMSVHFNGEEIRLFHLGPGHTDGDTLVYFTKSGAVHMGDQFFNGRFPFVDLGSGGDVAGLTRNIEAALQLLPKDIKVIPGHGALGTRSDLETYLEMLKETTSIVSKAIADGKTLDQVKAAGLPEKYKEWGTGFINTSRWLEISFNSLSKK